MADDVEHVLVNSPEELLAELRLSNPRWSTGKWIFRGHWGAEWELIPSAWDKRGREQFPSLWDSCKQSVELAFSGLESSYRGGSVWFDSPKQNVEWLVQHNLEVTLAYEYHRIADEQGMEVPSLPPIQHVCSLDWSVRPNSVEGFYCGGVLELLAVAQHHELPTRLLDWTYNSLIAAFFAADYSQRTESNSEYLTIWALNTSKLPILGLTSMPREVPDGLSILHVPRRRNSFVHAQDAVFTFLHAWRTVDLFRTLGRFPRFCAEDIRRAGTRFLPQYVAISMPKKQADDLLALLEKERITLARLQPTYANVTKALKNFYRNAPWRGSPQ